MYNITFGNLIGELAKSSNNALQHAVAWTLLCNTPSLTQFHTTHPVVITQHKTILYFLRKLRRSCAYTIQTNACHVVTHAYEHNVEQRHALHKYRQSFNALTNVSLRCATAYLCHVGFVTLRWVKLSFQIVARRRESTACLIYNCCWLKKKWSK